MDEMNTMIERITYIGKSNKNTKLDDGFMINGVWTVVSNGERNCHFTLAQKGKFFSKQLGVKSRVFGDKIYLMGRWDISVIGRLYDQMLI